MTTPESPIPASQPTPSRPRPSALITDRQPNYTLRLRLGVFLALFGLLVFVIGAAPGWFGLDRSPVTGFVQIAVFLVGLGFISLGGYTSLSALWNGGIQTLFADIGMRLVSTGYVVAVVSGLADVFGFGSETFPKVPSFGIWQLRGVLVGQVIIAVGFLLLIPWQHRKAASEPEPAKIETPPQS